MSPLPADVLLLIFDLLVLEDKLECMTVCRQWHNFIQHHSLFRVIYIEEEEKFNQLIEKVKRNPALGAQVERLELTFWFDEDNDATIIGDLFPNLRDFSFCTHLDVDEDKPIEPQQGHPWCEKMEKMADSSNHRGVQTLLLSGLCKNLTGISVSGPDNENVRGFFSALVNAPALKTLWLEGYTIAYQDFELIHKNTPLLHSLSMNVVTFSTPLTSLDIDPATSLKILRCSNAEFESDDSFDQYLPYISRKYTHLEELALEFDIFWFRGEGDDDYNNHRMAEQRAKMLSYMKALAPRLKKCLLLADSNESGAMNRSFDFNILDDAGCQIEKLTVVRVMKPIILERLSRTTQAQYIQSLTVHRFLIKEGDSKTISLGWLACFTALKELSLYFILLYEPDRKYRTTLTDLLINLKGTQLKSLTLSGVRLEVNGYENNFVYPFLKELTLDIVSLEIGADMYLSQMLPNLKRLRLIHCFEEGGSLMLPNTDLSYLEIVIKPDFPILVITLGDGQHRLYNTSRRLDGFHLDKKNEQQDRIDTLCMLSKPLLYESKDAPKLMIICKSVYNVNVK